MHEHFEHTFLNNVLIAISSSLVAFTALYPTDILRQHMNNHTQRGNLTIATATKQIITDYGYRYFYKGYTNLLVSLICYRALYNGTYDNLKVRAKTMPQKAAIAYLCAILSELATYPIEITRRRRIVVNAKEGLYKYGMKIWNN
jgi:hypothetical protein